MKKIIGILAILLLVIACAPKAEIPEETKEQIKEMEKQAEKLEEQLEEIKKTTPTIAPAPSPPEQEEPEPAEEEMSEQLKELLALADQKVKSYRYLLGEPPENHLLDTYFIKGNKVRINLFEYDPYDPETYFDNVYLDYDAKTAFGYCQSRKRCINKQADNTKKKWELNFEDYIKKTPYEWLKEVPDSAKITGPQVHESRTTLVVEFERGGSKFKYWIDDTYGMPVKIEKITAGQKEMWNFNDFLANTLKDSDVEPPFV